MRRNKPTDPSFRAGAAVSVRRSRKGRTFAAGLPNRDGKSIINPAGRIRRKSNDSRGRRIFVITGVSILSLLLVLVIAVTIFWSYIFSGFRPDKGGKTTPFPSEALTNEPPYFANITNILLIGTDSRDPENDRGRSDSLIILTVDKKHNTIKMASIMRDSYAYIPGGLRSPDKINAAYAYGGPEMAVRTVNSTFRLSIRHYITVNMDNMASIVDLAGGIMINVTKEEMSAMNSTLRAAERITMPGEQLLNGKQAVSYARVRKVGSDTERTRRQRDVLAGLFKVFTKSNVFSKAQMIQKGLSLIESNMSAVQLTSLGTDVLPKMSSEIKQMRLPPEGYYQVNATGSWYMVVDYNRLIPVLYDFIYEEQFPFDPVPTIPYNAEKTSSPTKAPASGPTAEPTAEPTSEPTSEPTTGPTTEPTTEPTAEPTIVPTAEPTSNPTIDPNLSPSVQPSPGPTSTPTLSPTPIEEPTSEADP